MIIGRLGSGVLEVGILKPFFRLEALSQLRFKSKRAALSLLPLPISKVKANVLLPTRQ